MQRRKRIWKGLALAAALLFVAASHAAAAGLVSTIL